MDARSEPATIIDGSPGEEFESALVRGIKPLFSPVSAVDLIAPFLSATTEDRHSARLGVGARMWRWFRSLVGVATPW